MGFGHILTKIVADSVITGEFLTSAYQETFPQVVLQRLIIFLKLNEVYSSKRGGFWAKIIVLDY